MARPRGLPTVGRAESPRRIAALSVRSVAARLARRPSLLVLSLTLLTLAGCQTERPFPDQPITLVCPWSPGGGTDRVSRQIAVELEAELGVPVNVVNATGGGGVTGHTRGARARPDGYTLSMITVELSMLHWRGLTNLTHRDFAPVQLLNRDSAALFVRGDSPYRTLDDLQAAVTSSQAKLKASGTAFGGVWHIAVAGWLDSRGLAPDAVTWVSINGAGPSVQELIAGGLDFICCSLPEADAAVAGGQVRCLGVMSDQRITGFEQVPTFREQGHPWSLAGWRGLALPRETPADRVETIARAVERVTAGESFQRFMAESRFDLSLENPARFATTLEQQDELFGAILTDRAFRSVSGDHFGPMLFPTVIALALPVVMLLVFRDHRRGVAGQRAATALIAEPANVPTDDVPTANVPTDNASASAASSPRGVPFRDAAHGWWWRSGAMLLAVAFYAVAAERLGFILTALLMLVGTFAALGVPRRQALLVAGLVAVIIYQVFGILLRVPLPRGFLEW